MALERGRARALATARQLDAADLRRITDPARRERFLAARDHYLAARADRERPVLFTGEPDQLPTDPAARRTALDAARQVELGQRDDALRRARAAFDAAVAAIRAAGDPADFLLEDHQFYANIYSHRGDVYVP